MNTGAMSSAHGRGRNQRTARRQSVSSTSGASLDQSFRFKELRASCFKVKTKPSGTGWICAKNGLISSSPNLTVVLAEKPDRLGKLILGFPPRLHVVGHDRTSQVALDGQQQALR